MGINKVDLDEIGQLDAVYRGPVLLDKLFYGSEQIWPSVNPIPPSLPTLWLNADSLSQTQGQTIPIWPDDSGNGNDATPSGTSFMQEAFTPATTKAVYLTGEGSIPNITSGWTGGSMMWVYRTPTSGTQTQFNGWGTHSWPSHFPWDNQQCYTEFGSSNRPGPFDTVAAQTWYVMCQTMDGTLNYYRDDMTTPIYSATQPMSWPTGSHSLGPSLTNMSQFLVWNRVLTVQERTDIADYLVQTCLTAPPLI